MPDFVNATMAYQLFLIKGIMNLTLTVEVKSIRFHTRSEALEFYTKGRYAELSRGSTEDHEEYKVLGVKEGKLYEANSTSPLKRNSAIKNGDFVVVTNADGDHQIFVDTSSGLQPITSSDSYE